MSVAVPFYPERLFFGRVCRAGHVCFQACSVRFQTGRSGCCQMAFRQPRGTGCASCGFSIRPVGTPPFRTCERRPGSGSVIVNRLVICPVGGTRIPAARWLPGRPLSIPLLIPGSGCWVMNGLSTLDAAENAGRLSGLRVRTARRGCSGCWVSFGSPPGARWSSRVSMGIHSLPTACLRSWRRRSSSASGK